MKPFGYHRPGSIGDASALLRSIAESKVIAGGMTLIPALRHGLAAPSALVDLGGLGALRSIEVTAHVVRLGAMVTHAQVARSPEIALRLPALARLAGGIGDAQVRHRGTAGGSIANNDPAADYPAACLALGATIVTDRREIPADAFFTGFFATCLEPTEIVTSVHFPVAENAAYAKFANQASRYATVGVFVARWRDRVRVAVTGAGREGVFRVTAMERALEENFSAEAIAAVAVPPEALTSDLHAGARYRSHLVTTMAKRAVIQCLGGVVRAPVRHGGSVSYP
jgi:carbon-monoxide dehydrogenase medium subunit